MNPSDAVRQLVIRPQSIASGAATAYVVDTAGYDYAEFEIDLGAVGSALTALKLQESDVKASATSLTGGTDVPGSIFGTSYTWDLPSNVPCAPGGSAAAATGTYPETGQYPLSALPATANTIATIHVDLKGRKRYLLLAATIAATTLISASVRLSRAEVAPHVPAQMVPANGGSAAVGNVLQVPPIYPNASGT